MISVDGGSGHITRDPSIAAFYMLIHNTGEGEDHLIGASSEACSRIGMQQMGNPQGSDLAVYVVIPADSVVEFGIRGISLALL